MRLWIAEKPDAGRQIAKALGGGHENGGHIKLASGDVVSWTIGHLLESYMPHEYDPRYQKWDLADLPILPAKFMSKPESSKASQLGTLTRLIKSASSVVIATDAGREGEAIAWSVLDHAGWKGPAQRFWTSSLSETALKKAVVDLIDDKEKKSLYIAARLRSSMDWSDGINWSRYYGIRCGNYGDKPLSLGRVQTATLAILVDRDLAIKAFVASAYYDLKATLNTPQGKLELFHAPTDEKRITDKNVATDIAQRARGQATTLKVETKPKTLSPPTPYSLPELQMHCSSLWGWTADKTLDVLQKLYEAGAVTYPRTDSGHLTEDMTADMPKHLGALAKRPQYKDMASITPTFRKSIFDDSKVADHHGIIPTDEAADISRLGPDAEFLFDLIARRFVAALMPDAKAFATSIRAMIGGTLFSTSGQIITELGWKAVWKGLGDPDDKKDEDSESETKTGEIANRTLPQVTDGQPAIADQVDVIEKTTRPPPFFTEGTLLKAMMSAGAKDPDAEIRELLSNGGLGTQATRHEIIKKLKTREFATMTGKKIVSTPRAREFISIIRTDGNRLADVQSTASLERELRLAEKDPGKAMEIWKRYASSLRQDIADLKSGPAPRRMTPSPRGAKAASGYGAKSSGSKYGSKATSKGKAAYAKKSVSAGTRTR